MTHSPRPPDPPRPPLPPREPSELAGWLRAAGRWAGHRAEGGGHPSYDLQTYVQWVSMPISSSPLSPMALEPLTLPREPKGRGQQEGTSLGSYDPPKEQKRPCPRLERGHARCGETPTEPARRVLEGQAGAVPTFTATSAPRHHKRTRALQGRCGRQAARQQAGRGGGLGARSRVHPAAICSPPLPTKYTHTHPFVPPPLIHSSTNVSIHPSISPSLSCTHPSTHPPPSPIRLRVSGYPRTTHHQSVNLAMHLVFPSVNRSLCMRVWCPRTGASLP